MTSDGAQPLLQMSPGRLTWRGALLVFVFGLLALVPGILPLRGALSHHEVMVAEPAREMLNHGDWIVPEYLGVVRHEKPPTTSWLVAASIWLTGSDSDWVVRLPSMLGAILSAALIAVLAARWLGEPVGILAGLIQLTTYWMHVQGRLAEADAILVAAVSAAFVCFAWAVVPHPRPASHRTLLAVGFYVATGAAFLLKGPVGVLFILLGAVGYLLLTRQWRQFRFLLSPVGLPLFLLMVIAWPLAAVISYPPIWHLWIGEMSKHAAGDVVHTPIWAYAAGLPAYLLPWTPLLVLAAFTAFKRKLWRHPLSQLLLAWMTPGMVMLHLAPGKDMHYSYPLLPPVSIAMACGLVYWLRLNSPKAVVPRKALAALLVIAAAAGAVAGWELGPEFRVGLVAVSAVVTLGLSAAMFLEHRRRIVAAIVALFTTVLGTYVIADLAILAKNDMYIHRAEFARTIPQLVGSGDEPIYLVSVRMDSMSWYTPNPMRRADDLEAFTARLAAQNGPVYALIPEGQIPSIAAIARVERLGVPDDMDGGKRRWHAMTLIRISPAAPTTKP